MDRLDNRDGQASLGRRTLRVAVIGAGIVGASVAFRLSQGGARVWLVDKAEPASGTTSASFAWVNAN
ncbi:MAG: FAD-dependent oxidoreductase, partial [Rubrobacteraceae bacterium]